MEGARPSLLWFVGPGAPKTRAGYDPLRAEGPQEHTSRTETFRKQVADAKLLRKQIADDEAGHGLKDHAFRTKQLLLDWSECTRI